MDIQHAVLLCLTGLVHAVHTGSPDQVCCVSCVLCQVDCLSFLRCDEENMQHTVSQLHVKCVVCHVCSDSFNQGIFRLLS